MDNLASLDIKGISTNINALIIRLDKVLESMHMGDISAGVTNTLASLNQLITSPDITNSLASVRTTLDQYRALGEKLTGQRGSAGRKRHQLAGRGQSHPGATAGHGG